MCQIFKLACLVIFLILCGDFISWLLIPRGNTEFVYRKGANSHRLFVFLPGMVADGRDQSKNLSDILLENGNLLVTNYSGDRFRPKTAIERIVDRVNKFKEDDLMKVVFIGTSMGGMMAYEVYLGLLNKGWRSNDFQFVLVDSPIDSRNYKRPLNYLTLPFSLMRPGFISNLVKLPGTFGFKNSFACDQLRYICKRKVFPNDSLSGPDVILAKSTHDDLVSDSCIESWQFVAGEGMRLILVDSIHAGFNEFPEIWQSVFRDKIIPWLE